MKTEGDDSNSLLKVAEVLGSVGAGNILSGIVGSAKKAIPKTSSATGAGAGV